MYICICICLTTQLPNCLFSYMFLLIIHFCSKHTLWIPSFFPLPIFRCNFAQEFCTWSGFAICCFTNNHLLLATLHGTTCYLLLVYLNVLIHFKLKVKILQGATFWSIVFPRSSFSAFASARPFGTSSAFSSAWQRLPLSIALSLQPNCQGFAACKLAPNLRSPHVVLL